jgi:hypothetical protein
MSQQLTPLAISVVVLGTVPRSGSADLCGQTRHDTHQPGHSDRLFCAVFLAG